MKKAKTALVFLLLAAVALSLPGCRGISPGIEKPGENRVDGASTVGSESITGTHPNIFVSAQDLQSYIAQQGKEEKLGKDLTQGSESITRGKILSGVAPHHLVAGKLIADFFSKLAVQKPAALILVGPNHSNRGGKVITGLNGWQTPEGLVLTDQAIVRELLDAGLAVRDEEVLDQEHSIGSLTPFVRHYLPESRVVPMILHHDVSLQEVDSLLQKLAPHLEKGAVLVASVDFSHYLKRREAEAKDEITSRLMKEFDCKTLYRLDDDHLDSPASLAMALRAAKNKGIRKFTLLDHTNSGILLNNDSMETTSYFTFFLKIE